MNKKMRLKK